MTEFKDYYLHCLTDGTDTELSATSKPYVAFYFSAHWCPPCQRFTPKLIEAYQHLKDRLEIIYVSSDHNEEQYRTYYEKMPWLAYPFGDSRIHQLSNSLGVRGIPSLQILTTNGEIITTVGVNNVTADPKGINFPWKEKKIKDLTINSNGINEKPSVCILADQPESTSDGVLDDVLDRLEKEVENLPLCFFYSRSSNPITEQIRKLTQTQEKKPMVIILDCPDNGGYYVMEKPFTEANLVEFVNQYLVGEGHRLQMKG